MAGRPAAVAFDAVETIFSLSPVSDALAGVGVALDLYFTRLLRDGFALAAAGDHQTFAEIARSALTAVAPGASEERLDRVIAAFAELPAHADAEPAVSALRDAHIGVVTLTNGSAETTRMLLEANGLARYFERVFSVDDFGRWKPSPDPYLHMARANGRSPGEIALVAVHSWDVHGAHRAGLTTGWCSRLEAGYPAIFHPPDVSGPDLVAVVEQLLALPT